MSTATKRWLRAVTPVVVVVSALSACDNPDPVSPAISTPVFAVAPTQNNLVVCKYGSAATIEVSIDGGAAVSHSLADGECKLIDSYFPNPGDPLYRFATVTEIVQSGTQLNSIQLDSVVGVAIGTRIVTGSNGITTNYGLEVGATFSFNNSVVETGEGCTPGYWRNHIENWPVSPSLSFDAVFSTNLFNPDITLGTAITLGGGGVNKLARHGTAAYLSSLAGINYPYTTAQVIAYVQAGNSDVLAAANELPCPLN